MTIAVILLGVSVAVLVGSSVQAWRYRRHVERLHAAIVARDAEELRRSREAFDRDDDAR